MDVEPGTSPDDIARKILAGVRPEFHRALVRKPHWFEPEVREALVNAFPLSEVDVQLDQETRTRMEENGIRTIGDFLRQPLTELLPHFSEGDLGHLGRTIHVAQSFRNSFLGPRGSIGGRVLDEIPVADLGLSTRPLTMLKRAGIVTVAQLVERTEMDLLLVVRNFGPKALENVVTKLAESGLSLKTHDRGIS